MVPEEPLGEEDIKQQISVSVVYSVRFSAVPVLFGFAGWNKSCCKQINEIKYCIYWALAVAFQFRLKFENFIDTSTHEHLKDFMIYQKSKHWFLVSVWIFSASPIEPDLAVAGVHPLSSTSVAPHSPSFPVGPVLLVLLQDTRPTPEV